MVKCYKITGRFAERRKKPNMERIQYTPELTILNTKFLAPGLGLRFLECIRSHTGELIAKKWHRIEPKNAAILVVF